LGGQCNTACGNDSTVSGGYSNTASGNCSFVGGGRYNTASVRLSFIGGGDSNTASGNCSFVGGGKCNTASGVYSTVSGGCNTASGKYSTISGGYRNTVSGCASAILGGQFNTISNAHSFIIGSCLTSSADCTSYHNALSKTSGTFRISHPDPSKTDTKYLQHSFVESPTRGDNIYRFKVETIGCNASLALPNYYKFLNENDQVWVSPVCHFGSAYGVIDNCQSCVGITSNCDGEYNVLVIGTRKDKDAKDGFLGVEIWK
jgi:hypothetical protein